MFVAYWDNSGQFLRLRKSLNGGLSYEEANVIAERDFVWETEDPPLPGNFRHFPFAYLAVDSINGILYCVFEDVVVGAFPNEENVELFLTKSIDDGETWTLPVIINSDANPVPGDQFWPWIEVDVRGHLHMVFMDSRHTPQSDDEEHGMLDAYYAYSNDQGTTWQEFRLTPSSFDSFDDGQDPPFSQFLGDYLGLGTSKGKVYPCYLSTQNGHPDIFVHVVSLPGACCMPDGTCQFLAEPNCITAGGSFQGDATECTPTGGCCLPSSVCEDRSMACCLADGGTFLGPSVACDPTIGECCMAAGRCVNTTSCDCMNRGGFFLADVLCHPIAGCQLPP